MILSKMFGRIVLLSLILHNYVYSQPNDILIGDWYFYKATSANGSIIRQSPNFYRLTITGKKWGIVYFSIENERRNIQYSIKENTITLHFTNSNLDPTFKLSIIDINNLSIENQFGRYFFQRIFRIKKDNEKTVYLFREDSVVTRNAEFKTAKFKGNLAKYLLSKIYESSLKVNDINKIEFILTKSGTIQNIKTVNRTAEDPTDSVLHSLIMLTEKNWIPARIGSKKADQKILLSFPQLPGDSLMLDNDDEFEVYLQNQWIHGKTLQDKEEDLAAMKAYEIVENGFNFLSYCSLYSYTKNSASVFETYLNAMCNKGIILVNIKRLDDACATFKKIRSESLTATKLFEENCR